MAGSEKVSPRRRQRNAWHKRTVYAPLPRRFSAAVRGCAYGAAPPAAPTPPSAARVACAFHAMPRLLRPQSPQAKADAAYQPRAGAPAAPRLPRRPRAAEERPAPEAQRRDSNGGGAQEAARFQRRSASATARRSHMSSFRRCARSRAFAARARVMRQTYSRRHAARQRKESRAPPKQIARRPEAPRMSAMPAVKETCSQRHVAKNPSFLFCGEIQRGIRAAARG